MAPSRLSDFVEKLRSTVDAAMRNGDTPVVLVGQNLRPHVRAIVDRVRPSVSVLGQNEIAPRARIRTVGTI